MVIVFWHQETGKLTKNTELNLSHFIGFYTPILTHHHILLVIDSMGKQVYAQHHHVKTLSKTSLA